MNPQKYVINIRPGVGIPPTVNVSQGDIERPLLFTVMDGLTPLAIDSEHSTVTITGTKPSGLGYTITGDIDGSDVTFYTTEQMTQESGFIRSELIVTGTGSTFKLGSANFDLVVEPTTHGTGVIDGTTEDARTVLERCEEYASDAAASAAEAASEAGAAATAGATAGTAAAEAVVDDIEAEISDLKSDFSYIVNDYDTQMWEKGGMGTHGVDDSYRQECRIRTVQGFVFPLGVNISAKTYPSVRIYAYTFSGSTETASGWVQSVTINPNQQCRIMIEGSWGTTPAPVLTVDQIIANLEIEPIIEPLSYAKDLYDNAGLPIPKYYFENNYLSGIVDKIYDNSPKDGLMFAFITDFHVSDNACQSPKLIKYLKKHTNACQNVIFGGDVLISTYADGVEPMSDAQKWQQYMELMGKDNVYQAVGNHDYLGYHYVGSSRVGFNEPWKTCRQLVLGNLVGNVVWCPNKMAYYFDVPTANTRIIVGDDFDTPYNQPDFTGGIAFSNEQRAWVVNTALNVENMRIIYVSHLSYDTGLAGDDEHADRFVGMQNLFKAMVNKTNYSYGATVKDFTNSTLQFVAHFCGHSHADEYHTDDNVLTIRTNCDAIYDTTNRIKGTTSEQAFDVVAVDYDAKTIKTVRVGYGSDRSFVFT